MMDDKVTMCCRCGAPLSVPQVGATLRGDMIDWIEKGMVIGISMTFCYDCMNAIHEILEAGVEGAVEKFQEEI